MLQQFIDSYIKMEYRFSFAVRLLRMDYVMYFIPHTHIWNHS